MSQLPKADPRIHIHAELESERSQLTALHHEARRRGILLIHRILKTKARIAAFSEQLKLLDAEHIFVHVMTNHNRHRVIRVIKNAKPAPHDDMWIRFSNDGNIALILRGVSIPLKMHEAQWISASGTSYMVIPYFFKSEANHSVRQHTS